MTALAERSDVPPIAWRRLLAAAGFVALLLTVFSAGYGFHRDELYFRMLPPAWGYVDQPPLAPTLARWLSAIVDEPWMLRIPATLATAAAVLLAGLLARQAGGDRRAQSWAAWGTAVATMPLCLGHLLLTAALDLPLWLGITLATVVALRRRPGAWLLVGTLIGLATYNRLLVAVLGVSIACGVIVFGPQTALRRWQLWAGVGLAAVVAAPNLFYQATNGWPQLAMGEALSTENRAEVRAGMPLMLAVMLSPVWVPVWLTGLVQAWCCRETRWLLVAFIAIVGFTFNSGAQPHYPVAVLVALFALGCVPFARWAADRRWLRFVAGVTFVVQACAGVVMALPVLPPQVLAQTPLPDLNQLPGDQIGWPRYVQQVADAYRSTPVGTVIITDNYGEAGAIARYGPALGLPQPFSGHNALGYLSGPPEQTRSVLFVGDGPGSTFFARCEALALLDSGGVANEKPVPNEEQGQPVSLCVDPSEPWSVLWPKLRHLS